jgi:DNA-binding GntR family transcriptional regulator
MRHTDDSQRSLRSRVSQGIRRMILSGELRPGNRLPQQQLAKSFGVSQSVLREALLEVQFTGLVESVNGIGMSVARIDAKQLFDAYEVREMLEGVAARLCCAQASPADLRELTDLAHQVHALGVAAKDRERAQLDRQFHERTIAISGNDALSRLSGGYHIVRLVVLTSVPHDQVLADHLAIIEAIKANDPMEAERAARVHVAHARELVHRQIEANHFRFPMDAQEKAPQSESKS